MCVCHHNMHSAAHSARCTANRTRTTRAHTQPQGTTSDAGCVPAFTLVGAATGSRHADYLPMAPAALTTHPAADADACQAACGAAASPAAGGGGCQYHEWRSGEADGQRCRLRLAGLGVLSMANAVSNDEVAKVLFLVSCLNKSVSGWELRVGARGCIWVITTTHTVAKVLFLARF